MTVCSVDVPASLKTALNQEASRQRRSLSSIVTEALARYLEKPIHTLFQVSTSGALVAGVYEREVTVRKILEHGDFGLGTFANLDGEMVVLDGRVYQVQDPGRVSEASPDAGAPFAVVTRFDPSIDVSIDTIGSFEDLETRCDVFRRSGNIFYALRLEGRFQSVRARAVKPPQPGGDSWTPQVRRANSTSRILTGLLSGCGRPVFRAHSALRAIISIFCPPTVSMEVICSTCQPRHSGFASKR